MPLADSGRLRLMNARKTLLGAAVGAAVGAWIARHGLHFDVRNQWPMLLGVAPFIVLSVVWAVAANNRAPDLRSEAPMSAMLHQVLVSASLFLIVFPIAGLTARMIPNIDAVIAIGLLLELCGLGLAIAARRELGRNWSAQVRIAEGHALIRTGPYRYLRHPIYTGALCMYAGLAIVSGTLHAVLGFTLVCLAYWRKTVLEEHLLADQFGARFDDYRRRSWAIIPLVL